MSADCHLQHLMTNDDNWWWLMAIDDNWWPLMIIDDDYIVYFQNFDYGIRHMDRQTDRLTMLVVKLLSHWIFFSKGDNMKSKIPSLFMILPLFSCETCSNNPDDQSENKRSAHQQQAFPDDHGTYFHGGCVGHHGHGHRIWEEDEDEQYLGFKYFNSLSEVFQ